MHQQLKNPHHQSPAGMTLIELLMAILLASFLITGLVQIVSAASSSFRLQENQAEVLENGRHAIATISKTIRQAGFSPQPWNSHYVRDGLMAETTDQATNRSDRLVLRAWSDTNCYGNRNPVKDGNGRAVFFIRVSLFDLNSRGDLARTCKYGPANSQLVTQINHEGFIRNVESFQTLFGQDSTQNGQVDNWVKAGDWNSPNDVVAVRIGLLLRSDDSVVAPEAKTIFVLDQPHTSKADGRIHKLFVFTTPIKDKSG